MNLNQFISMDELIKLIGIAIAILVGGFKFHRIIMKDLDQRIDGLKEDFSSKTARFEDNTKLLYKIHGTQVEMSKRLDSLTERLDNTIDREKRFQVIPQ